MRILSFKCFLLFITPAMLVYLTFFIGPIFSGLYYSFTDWNGYSFQANFIGFDNFVEVFKDPLLGKALRNMVALSVVVILIQHSMAMLLALLLDRKLKGVLWMRVIIFFPAILNTVVIGYIWSYMYSPLIGFFPKLFEALGLHSLASVDWLGSPSLAIYAIAFVIIWQSTGYSMMIYLSGLQTIPAHLYEAAQLDGANAWHRYWRVTLPLLVPSIIVNTVLSVIGCLRQFEHVFIMTQGGPVNSTQVFGTLIYEFAFKTSHMGYGTAMALLLSILISVIAFIQIRLMSRLEVKY